MNLEQDKRGAAPAEPRGRDRTAERLTPAACGAGEVVALVSDLIFGSKISATAGQVGVPVRIVRSVEEVLAATRDARGLIVDMNAADGDTLQLVRDAKAARPDLPVVAFLSHVQVELWRQTQAAGADEVLPRSKFTETLPAILRRLGGGP